MDIAIFNLIAPSLSNDAFSKKMNYQDIILLILKGLPVEYNPFKSHIRARPVRVTLPELCDLLFKEECDLDDAVKFFNSPIMIAMVAQKGTVSLSPHVAHGDNFHSGLVDRGVANPNWQLNWNRPTNYRGRGSWSRGKSWNNGGRGNTWNNNGGGNNGPNWNGSTNKWNHGGQSGNSYGQWNQGSGSWNNNAGFNNTGSWHSTSGPWHLRGNSGSFTQYFVSPNSIPGVLSPSPTAPPVSTVASSLATETCQICLQFGHTTPNCPHRTNFSYQGIPPSLALTALTATASGSFSDPNIWLIDSGATNHMTSDLQLLSNITPSTSTDNVTISNGTGLRTANVGSSSLVSGHQVFHLLEVLHVPNLATNLLSVHRFCLDNHCQILYNALWFQIQDLQGRILYQGQFHNGLCPLPTRTPSLFPSLAAFHGHKVCHTLWHYRLVHPSHDITRLPHICSFCLQGKMCKQPFPSSHVMSQIPFEVIHSDIWCPTPYSFLHGHRYYFATSIKTFQSDGGDEYVSKDFQTYLGSKGILHHKSCPYTPEQNGRTERKHRHLVEIVVTLLTIAALPSKYLFHALSTANYLINRMLCKSLGMQSPFSKLFHKEPNITLLKVFGCACYPLLRPYTQSKVQPRSEQCVFLGYTLDYKGYLCLVPKTDRIYISRHVVFDETCFPFKSSSFSPESTKPLEFTPLRPSLSPRSYLHSASTPRLDGLPQAPSTNQLASPVSNAREVVSSVDVIDSSTEFSPSLDLIVDLPAPPVNSHPMQTRFKSGIIKSQHGFLAAKSTSGPSLFHEPQTYSQAAKVSEWNHAMVDEFQALEKQHTWTFVPYQPSMNIVGCKWVFKLKKNADGSISRHKARLVAKGFHQEVGLDYDETSVLLSSTL
ncbi:unnamed protein product [Prunus armeniaca]